MSHKTRYRQFWGNLKMSEILRLVVGVLLVIATCVAAGQNGPNYAALQQQAASGNPQAEYNLGQCYANGRGVPQDYAEAARWFHKAAEQGLVVAQNRIANVLLYGYGVTQSTTEALEWFQKAAEHGDVESAYMLGQIYEAGGPNEITKRPDGTFSAGPVPQSAAIPKDFERAVYWYHIAANHGEALAQNRLGQLYASGEGVPQNYREAYFWLSLAEANGETSTTDGIDDRDVAASHLTNAALLQVQERARKWFEDHSARTPTQ